MRYCLLIGCVGLLAISAGCSTDTSAADAQAIKAKNDEWSKAGAAKDSAKFGTFYADDATVMIPNEPIFRGMDSIKAVLAPMMQDPNFALSFKTDKVEVSGSLGYTQGSYSMTNTARDGKPFVDTGKYLTVWRKQADNSWKAIEDIFNSDLPPGGN
jgi:ketosteroid isomerase-like protein